ncbi:MAG: LPD7 domain-containing protein [Rhodoferax sp.]
MKSFTIEKFPSGNMVLTDENGESFNLASERLEDLKKLVAEHYPGAELKEFVWDAKFGRIVDRGVSICNHDPIVHKKENGDHLFTDRGNRVTFDRVRVSDDEIRLALAHAQQKFGQQLTLTGDDPIFTERMARLADDMGMTIINPEMQPVIAAHRAALACQAPSVAPPMPPKRRGVWQQVLRLIRCAANLAVQGQGQERGRHSRPGSWF